MTLAVLIFCLMLMVTFATLCLVSKQLVDVTKARDLALSRALAAEELLRLARLPTAVIAQTWREVEVYERKVDRPEGWYGMHES